MILRFNKLETKSEFLKISFDGMKFDEYLVSALKANGLEFTAEQCPDITKIVIKGAISELNSDTIDVKKYIEIEGIESDISVNCSNLDVSTLNVKDSFTVNGSQIKVAELAKTSDLNNLATAAQLQEVKNKIPSTEGFITADTLTSYAKTTDIPSLDGYAKTADIPDMSNYVSSTKSASSGESGCASTVTNNGYTFSITNTMDSRSGTRKGLVQLSNGNVTISSQYIGSGSPKQTILKMNQYDVTVNDSPILLESSINQCDFLIGGGGTSGSNSFLYPVDDVPDNYRVIPLCARQTGGGAKGVVLSVAPSDVTDEETPNKFNRVLFSYSFTGGTSITSSHSIEGILYYLLVKA